LRLGHTNREIHFVRQLGMWPPGLLTSAHAMRRKVWGDPLCVAGPISVAAAQQGLPYLPPLSPPLLTSSFDRG